MSRADGAFSAGVLVLSRYGSSSRNTARSGLEHRNHRVSVLNAFEFLGACVGSTVGFTCHNDCMCRNVKAALVLLATKVRKRIDQVWFSSLVEESSFDIICSVIAFARFAEVDWTSLTPTDTWFPYRWETSEVVELAKVIRRCNVSVPLKAMLASFLKQCWPGLFISLLTGCFWLRILREDIRFA